MLTCSKCGRDTTPLSVVSGHWTCGSCVEAQRIEDFLEEVYYLARLNDIEEATNKIFGHIDRLLCDSAFFDCDEILKRVDVEKLPTTLMRSFLTITAPAKTKLSSRKALFEKIKCKLTQSIGEEKTRRIVGSLL